MKSLCDKRKEIIMRVKLVLLCICVGLLISLCSCTIRSEKKISDDVINAQKEEFEKYLAETYPDEKFTVEIWQEYSEKTGGAGLPDYEGYVLRQVITDSKGNRFKIFTLSEGKYSDDYQKVLDGTVHYNEKGQQVFYDDKGKVLFISDQ